MLLPKVKEAVNQNIKLESVITSVKRAKANYTILQGKITRVVAGSVLNIRTDMAKISVEKTKENLEKIRKTVARFSGEFLQTIEGISIITLISDLNSFHKISLIFAEETVVDTKQNLATVIIRSPDEIIYTPGCVQAFYNAVSRRHINIEETMSCFTETIIVLAMEDVSKAFAALTDLVAEARKKQ